MLKKKKTRVAFRGQNFQICLFQKKTDIKIETGLQGYEIKCAIANKKPRNFFNYFIKNTLLKTTLIMAKFLKLKDINRLGIRCFI